MNVEHGAQQRVEARIGRRHPLSWEQERLWFLQQLDPASAAYNQPLALRLRGRLERAVLERCLAEIVRRHEILRSTFALHGEGVVQVVGPPRPVPLVWEDLGGAEGEGGETGVAARCRQEARRRFDLAAGPLVRALVVACGPDEHVLVLTLHHLVVDGWSARLLQRELATLYDAFSRGLASPLEPLAVQYGDYARRQRDAWESQELARQLACWRERLAGAPPTLALPHDRPAPARPGWGGERVSARWDHILGHAVEQLGRRAGATPFMTLLAAWSVLLGRYADQEDLIVGIPVANRTDPDIAEVVGFFANTLPIRVRPSAEMGFLELVAQVRQRCLEAYEHQHLPLDRLVSELGVERGGGQLPLVQVMFEHTGEPPAPQEAAGLRLEPFEVATGTAKFSLSLDVEDHPGATVLTVEFRTDLYERATVARHLEHLRVLVEAVVADPAAPLGGICLLAGSERQRVLEDWNRTTQQLDRQRGLPELFDAQARRTPSAVAVESESQRLSYDELNRRANRLAHHLRELGVGPERCVAVCLRRSAEAVVSLLAVLKAGGVYVPLDPAHPYRRLSFMLADTDPVALVTTRPLAARLGTGRRPRWATVLVDADAEAIATRPDTKPPTTTSADHLAYVMYTSGSTGEPKGVGWDHTGILNEIAWTRRALSVGEPDRAAWIASPASPLSRWELWPYLTSGCCVCIAPPDAASSALELQDWLVRRRVTIAFVVTGIAQQLFFLSWPDPCPLRFLITGGEKVVAWPSPQLPFQTIVSYGTTELSSVRLAWFAMPRTRRDPLTPPVGRPIDNTTVYVLDRFGNPLPIGIPGELHVGGEGMAQGYRHDPEASRERFLPDPFRKSVGGRMYRTGDRGRFLPDGNVEVIGRVDDQVKIQGVRVEPREVERALLHHPAVVHAAVVAVSGSNGDRRLRAFVVPAASGGANEQEVRNWLRELLPSELVPSCVTHLPSLPLNQNGKVDRGALASMPWVLDESHADHVPATTDVQRALLDVWTSILGVEGIGVTDDFVALGGQSLGASQILTFCALTWGVRLSLREFLESPTIAWLDQKIAQGPRGAPTRQHGHTPLQDEAVVELVAGLTDEEVARVLEELDEIAGERS